MNNLAITPYICLHALQLQNVKRDVAKKIDITELNKQKLVANDKETEKENTVIENNQPTESTNIDNLPVPISYENNESEL